MLGILIKCAIHYAIVQRLLIIHNCSMAKSIIADNYIQEKLNPIIKPLIVDIIKEKPGDIPSFILNWINTHYPPAIKEPDSNV